MALPRRYLKGLIVSFLILILILGLLIWVGNINIIELPTVKTTKHLRIITMNVSADNLLSSDYQERLIKTNPDVIVIVEWTGNNIDLRKFKEAGYYVVLDKPIKRVHGLCILSKFNGESQIIEAPIETPCTLPLGQFRFKWQNHFITLFAIHAPPPVPSCKGTTDEYLIAISSWIKNGKLSSDLGVGEQGDDLILAGDFNSLSFQRGVKILKSKNLEDSNSSYSIISPTWKPFPYFPYIAKIDYIICSSQFKSKSCYRFVIDKSDHLGMIADLETE